MTRRRRSSIDEVYRRLRPVRYGDLPLTHQLAIAHYMAIDGEAWDSPASSGAEGLLEALPYYSGRYGNKMFNVADIPTRLLIEAMWAAAGEQTIREFETFKDYHTWYMMSAFVGMVRGPGRALTVWPVILSSKSHIKAGEGLFQDGWHRFHTYVERGLKTIPVIGYQARRRYF